MSLLIASLFSNLKYCADLEIFLFHFIMIPIDSIARIQSYKLLGDTTYTHNSGATLLLDFAHFTSGLNIAVPPFTECINLPVLTTLAT